MYYVFIKEKTKRKKLHEGNYYCSNCNKTTHQLLFSIKKHVKLYGFIPIFKIQDVKVLQCENCGIEKELIIGNLKQKSTNIEEKIEKALQETKTTYYNKNIRECDKCGNIIGDILELSKTEKTLHCKKCGTDLTYLIDKINNEKNIRNKGILYLIIIIGIITLLYWVLKILGVDME